MSLRDIFTLGWETTKRAFTRDRRISRAEPQTGSAAFDIASEEHGEDDELTEYWQQYYEELEIEEQRKRDEDLELEAQRATQPRQFICWEDADDWEAYQRVKELTEDNLVNEEVWGPKSRQLVVAKERLTWVSPLPDLSILTEADMITAADQKSEFLSQYLAGERASGISFEKRHAIINLLLRTVTASAFDAMQRWAPKELVLLQVQHADQLELQWWLALLSSISHQWPKPATTEGTDWDLLGECIGHLAVGQVRHKAVHREYYTTKLVKHAVKFLIALNDLKRFELVEKTIRSLYATLSGNIVASEEENSALDSALALHPKECKTTFDLFNTLEVILGNMYFRRAQANHQDWLIAHRVTSAEQIELSRPGDELAWNSLFGFISVNRELRNHVAHRLGLISNAELDHDTLQYWVEELKQVALDFGDQEAAGEITNVAEAALVHLKASSAAYVAQLNTYPVQQLRMMSQQARERYRKWDFTMDNSNHVIAQRYLAAFYSFGNLADLMDGTTYKGELYWIQKAANKAHNSWQTAQRDRFVVGSKPRDGHDWKATLARLWPFS